jgi:peptidoglycan/LPS O-acetylase OafA/YrhL
MSEREKMPASSATSVPSRLPSLDGWRAVSIAMVLGSHTTFAAGFPKTLQPYFNWTFDGNLGVRCFFLISGFLITWLMIVEHDRAGRVSLRHFYARRALRILPVYFGFLLVVALIEHFSPYELSRVAWIGNLTFTRDFVGSDFATDHLWSLSVEEQFYILWPGIFVALGMTRNRHLLQLLALPVLLAPLSRAIGRRPDLPIIGPVFAGYSFTSYFDSLAVGCACAILLSRHRDLLDRWLGNRRRFLLAVGLVLVGSIHILYEIYPKLFWLRILMFSLGPTIQALGMAILVLQSVMMPRWGLFQVLNWRWVCRIGVLSYSIYIWQQLFCTKPEVFGLGKVWWMSYAGWCIPVFAVASVSYYGFERPFLKLRARFREPAARTG